MTTAHNENKIPTTVTITDGLNKANSKTRISLDFAMSANAVRAFDS